MLRALVTRSGSIDWLCWPRFDSPAVFAELLDPGCGAFAIAPAGPFRAARRYLPGTNVLETRFTAAGGTGILLDFMPFRDEASAARALGAEREIVRILRCEAGELEVEVVVDPRPGFGTTRRHWRDARELGLHMHAGNELFAFRSEPPLPLSPEGGVRARCASPQARRRASPSPTRSRPLPPSRRSGRALQLPWYGYCRAGSSRMRSTFARVERELRAGPGLLYRYPARPEWREGAFGICGFWAAENAALGGGSAAEAESRITTLLRYANDAGLFAEQVDPATGEALGNFPQGFTHIGLVNACLTLQERLTGREQLPHQRQLPEAERMGTAA